MKPSTIEIRAAVGRAYSEECDELAQLEVIHLHPDEAERKRAENRLRSLRARRSARDAKAARRDEGATSVAVKRQNKADVVSLLSDGHQLVARLLREHTLAIPLRRPSDELIEGVRGDLSEMELYAIAARRGNEAWARFDFAIACEKVRAQCRKMTICEVRSLGRACDALGWGRGGKQRDRLKGHLCDGLEAAGAFLGVGL